MANYSFAQLETLWINAGGDKSLAPLAAGIAIVESSGNPQAYNASGASGLWQIEIPLHDSAVPGGAANVFNAEDNAKAAVTVSGNTLAGLTSNWLVDEPAGAAEAIVRQNGGTVPAATVSSTGTGTGQAATLDSDPLAGIVGGPVGYIMGNLSGSATGIADVATMVGRMGQEFGTALHWLSYLFNPSNWLRFGAFFMGLLFASMGTYMLVKAA